MNRTIVLILFFILTLNLSAQNWTTQTVCGSIDDWYYDASIAVDVQCRPHIACGGRNGLIYAKPMTDTWHCQTIDTCTSILKMCFDQQGYPHIAYLTYHNYANYVRYAYWNGSTWQITTIDSFYSGDLLVFFRERNLDLALSREGVPYLCYPFVNIINIDTISQVRCAYKRSNIWIIDTVWQNVPHESKFPLHTRIAFDTNNLPYLAFNLYTRIPTYTAWIKCARYNGSTWQIEVDRAFTDWPKIYGFKIDNMNRLHLLYFRHTNFGVYYAIIQNNIWTIEFVAGNGPHENLGDLALYNNQPHIVFSAIQSVLRYYYKMDNVWQCEIISYTNWLTPSLAIDYQGNKHVSLTLIQGVGYARRIATGVEEKVECLPRHSSPKELSLSVSSPTSSNLKISYGLPKDGRVKLTLYDLTGRVIKILTEEHQNAGYYKHSVDLQKDQLSNGIYFLSLELEQDKKFKKITILK